MKATRKVELLFCMVILIVTFSSTAKADEFDKLTIVTFNAQVELPGDLSAGTPIFKLVDNPVNPNIVNMLDHEQTNLRDYNFCRTPRPSDNTRVQVYPTGRGAPNAPKTWFYSGDISGQEFIYLRVRETELAETARQPVSVISSNLTFSQRRLDQPPVHAVHLDTRLSLWFNTTCLQQPHRTVFPKALRVRDTSEEGAKVYEN